jgi:hypothetical protein
MSAKWTVFAVLAALTIICQVPALHAQVRQFTGIHGVQVAPADPADDADVPEAPAPPDGVGRSLAAAVSSMKFDRSPESLLRAVQSQQSGKPMSEADHFRIAVILGDWETVASTLKAMSPDDAKSAYARMLAALVDGSQSAAQFYQQTPAARPGMQGPDNDSNARSTKALLLSDDFYAVLAASPADLTETSLKQVSELVKIAIGDAGRKEFLARLAQGLRGIGGQTPEGRKLAAVLLSNVAWITDAAPYLPLDRAQWEQADTLSLLLAMEHFTQAGIKDRDERMLRQAAEVCAFMMQTSRFGQNDQPLFRQATDRFVQLLPALESAESERLIRENFLTQPAILQDLLLVLGESGQKALKSSDLNLRAQSLATQNALLRVLAGRKGAPSEAVNLLVTNWLAEAETAYRSAIQPSLDSGGERDMNTIVQNYYARRNQGEPKVVKPEMIIANTPPLALVRRLNKGLAQRVNLTCLKVNLMDPKEPQTIDLLTSYIKDNPGQEKSLCQDYLVAWVRKRSMPAEDPNIARMRKLGYQIQRDEKDATGGIPLTRLRQNRNVAEFKGLLTSLRALSPAEPLDPALIVQGFMSIHSGAEVYQKENIEAIFGPAEKMEVNELMQLVSGMRGKLQQQWQDPKTQQGASTNRTETEVKDEVSRGYLTALDLLRRGLRPENADWRHYIIRGQLFFDASEFEFARQIKLSDYVNLRDEAFGSYRKAAEIYSSKVAEMPRGQWTIEPYQMWFFAMLGASDLSQLTKSAARADPGLKQIGDALRALPGEAAEGHLMKFGQMLSSLLSQVPGNLRQHFLGTGLQVVGKDHPGAMAASAALANYEELLDEVRLNLSLDGPADVGCGQPFGVSVGIEHTSQLARESGGFSKYLVNKAAGPGQAGPPAENRDGFTKNIHAALDETFEVLGITYHDPAVKAVDLPRDGWQETPVAYLLLRAKEAAVDRIPSIQMDMDFSDTSGRVVLPVRSQVLQLNAKSDSPPVRPCEDLGLTFTMDEREWTRDGRVVVEVAAKGNGVIASHEQLFDFDRPGFDVQVSDAGLSITEFVGGANGRAVNADRSWQFTYTRKKDVAGEGVMRFPTLKPGIEGATTEYQHYQDADLIPVSAKQAAQGIPLKGTLKPVWKRRIIAGVAVLLGVLALIYYLRRRKKRAAVDATRMLEVPSEITPFSVVSFLRRVEHEAGAKLNDAARASVRKQIDEIEASNYRNPPSPTDTLALEAIARQWLLAAR